jgi:hypothetical protein
MIFKKIQNLFLVGLIVVACISCCEQNREKQKNQAISNLSQSKPDTSDLTNNFYDNAEDHILTKVNLAVGGEVSNPGQINFKELPLHSITVKETLLVETGDKFIGAYRYDGYSLLDILNLFQIAKLNKSEFPPIIDLYIEVENAKGEKVKISWGEIYYPNHLHEIIIATKVMRIVPSKTKDLWPLPVESRLVCASDLVTERNISSPSKITVKSYPKSFVTVKGMSPVYSPDIKIYFNDELSATLKEIPSGLQEETYNTIFYGRGRGIHSTTPFEGFLLKDIMRIYMPPLSRQLMQTGLILIAAKDGYRGVYTFSEVMNRNDQSELLLIFDPDEKDGGAFRLFPASDFFSDRAIKAVESIYITLN